MAHQIPTEVLQPGDVRTASSYNTEDHVSEDRIVRSLSPCLASQGSRHERGFHAI